MVRVVRDMGRPNNAPPASDRAVGSFRQARDAHPHRKSSLTAQGDGFDRAKRGLNWVRFARDPCFRTRLSVPLADSGIRARTALRPPRDARASSTPLKNESKGDAHV